ncbi:hypothetical protein FQN49_000575 [Arthroderma sp. PD_2]|nr:hypothetical protein FQN49_000575 [Arthroderma sp. PD_2]
MSGIFTIRGLVTSRGCARLAAIYFEEFNRSKERRHIDDAISCSTKAATDSTNESLSNDDYIFHLGTYKAARYDQFGDEKDLESASMWLYECFDSYSCKKPPADQLGRYSKLLDALASCSAKSYIVTGDEEDFDEAISYASDALNNLHPFTWLSIGQTALKTADGLKGWGVCKKWAAGLYELLYSVSHYRRDLTEAIKCWEELLAKESSQSVKATYHLQTGRLLSRLSQDTRSSKEADKAARNRLKRDLPDSTTEEEPTENKRIKLEEEPYDPVSITRQPQPCNSPTLDEIKKQEEKVSAAETRNRSHRHSSLLEELADMYFKRYQAELLIKDGESARDIMMKAADSTPTNEFQACIHRLMALGGIYRGLYRKTFEVNYLDDGIEWARTTLTMCDDHRKADSILKASTQNHLALILADRLGYDPDHPECEKWGMEAIKSLKKAVKLMQAKCVKQDNCRYCRHRITYLRDLDTLKTIYPRFYAAYYKAKLERIS